MGHQSYRYKFGTIQITQLSTHVSSTKVYKILVLFYIKYVCCKDILIIKKTSLKKLKTGKYWLVLLWLGLLNCC